MIRRFGRRHTMGSCSIGSLCSLGHQKRWKAAGSSEAGLLSSGRRSVESCTKRSSGRTVSGLRVERRYKGIASTSNTFAGCTWRNQCTGKGRFARIIPPAARDAKAKYGPAGRSAEDKPAWPGARFRGGLRQSVAPLINFTPYTSTKDRWISKQHFRESF